MKKKKFREKMAAMPKISIKNVWDEHRMSLRKHAKNEPVKRFTHWSTVRATMFIGNAPYIDDEYEELHADKNWKSEWRDTIVDPGVGKPIQYPHGDDFRTSGNYIHLVYLLKKWREFAETEKVVVPSELSFFEFGGGYGAMANILCSYQSDVINYILFDLPEFSLLQRYYLEKVMDTQNVHFETALPKKPTKYDMFVSTAAMSEVPFSLRDRVFEFVYASHYLITFQHRFLGYDNMGYFREFAKKKGLDPDEHIHHLKPGGHWMLAI